jgi:flagellar motility protein MotE (MotC chaperone)
MRKGDIIAIILVALFTFPILYVAMLFFTGSLRVEYGFKEKDDSEQQTKIEEVKHNARRDSLAALNSKTFQAAEQERAGLVKEQERLNEQYARLEMLQAQIEKDREELVKERQLLENRKASISEAEAAEQRGETAEARYRKLAKIYEAMKPNEAANIMQTLPDAQVAYILSKMSDDRQKGKIMALLSTDKVARISKLIN